MTETGRRDVLVSIQRYTATQDEYGEEIKSWAEIAQEWAAVFYGRGDERRQAAREQGAQTATFNMLSNSITLGVKVEDRITFGGDNWDIVSKSPDTPKRGEIEFVAKRAL